ncbi:unnamed protein product [Lymnaea stagnalis]|uniref:Uncharacterized protein n=1 Tax=Lymnaea stagnalis TaxID=6523 RepID=A0AAV2HPX4_LYMST
MKRATLLGCFLKTFTTGVSWYWGNMSVYTDSYYRATLGPHSGFGTPWVMSTFLIGFSIGLVITERTARLIGRTWTNIVSFVLFESGILLSYLSLNSAASAMTGTMGVLAGLGSGITEGQLLYYVLAWSDHHVGFVSALVSSSYSGGSILINQFVTLYINPHNLSPDVKDGNNVYFTQTSVIERIPTSNIHTDALVIKENHGCTSNWSQNTSATTDDIRDMPLQRSCVDSYKGLTSTHHESVHVDEACNGRRQNQNNDSSDLGHAHENTKSTEDHTTWQMLQTKTFYTLWFCAIATDYGYIIMTNFYKTYGQIRIKHDHFLTNVAVVTVAASTLSEIGWGAVLDRIKVKHCLMLYLSSLALLGSFWFFTPIVSKYLYMLCTIMVCSMNAGMYVLFFMGIFKYFGTKNFSLNNGLIFSGSVVVNIGVPPVINLILKHYGWFVLFFSVGAVNALALIVAVLLLPAN